MFRIFYLGLFVLIRANVTYAQFNPGLDFNILVQNQLKLNEYSVTNYNENETFTDYKVSSLLNPLSFGAAIRNFGTQFQSEKKWCIGYSLGIGYHQFSTTSRLTFLKSSTANRDSIVANLHDAAFKTIHRTIFMSHFFDVHWNPSDRVKITNSFGFNITAMVQTKSLNTTISQRALTGNLPVFKLLYQPQITENYTRCAISYFAQFTVFAMDLLKNSPSNKYVKLDATPFSSLRFNLIGLRVMPHLRLPKTSATDELF